MDELIDLLPAGCVWLDARAADWREAIAAAGGLMVDAGFTTAEYTAMVARDIDRWAVVVKAAGIRVN